MAKDLTQQMFKEDLSDKGILRTAEITNQSRAKNT